MAAFNVAAYPGGAGMRVSFKLYGGPEMVKVLESLPLSLRRPTLYKILKKAAEPMRVRMGQLAPRSASGTRSTGRGQHLADNIVVSVARRIGSVQGGRWKPVDEFTAAVAVGPAQPFFYGLFQEYGTVHHGAQPFMRPAFDATAHRSLTIIQQEMWAAIRTAAGKGKASPMIGDAMHGGQMPLILGARGT